MNVRTQNSIYVLEKPLALIGFMGSGKSALGYLLSSALGKALTDSDFEVTKAARMSIADIFERDGEAFFRKKEYQVIDRLIRDGVEILATGGGAFCTPKTQELLLEKTTVVWLRADLDLIWSRVKDNPKRPLLQVENPRQAMQELYEKRVDDYARAHIIWDAKPGENKEAAADRLLQQLLADRRAGLTKKEML